MEKSKNRKTFIFLGPLLSALALTFFMGLQGPDRLPAQEALPDYAEAYSNGDYAGAYEAIRKRLLLIYDKRVDNKRIPSDFITAKKLEESVNLNELYRSRVAEGFFIEDNDELHILHLEAGRCLFKLGRYDESLNHYGMSLRFKELEAPKDDVIIAEIAGIYEKMGDDAAYARMLGKAYALNPSNYEHSLKLGLSLYRTAEKKKAIFHLERYVEWKGEALDMPGLYLLIAGLNEDIGRYLETVRYCRAYLAAKPEDGPIYFALGHIAFKRTGDYALARSSLTKALELLPDGDIFRRSKAFEYRADMAMRDLEFEEAVRLYGETIVYQDRVKKQIEEKDRELDRASSEIREIKSSLIKKPDFDTYNQYEYLMEEQAKLRTDRKERYYSYSKLDAGRVRWNIAECYERLGKLDEAMSYYRECIAFDYDSSAARDRIIKIQLKINRGY